MPVGMLWRTMLVLSAVMTVLGIGLAAFPKRFLSSLWTMTAGAYCLGCTISAMIMGQPGGVGDLLAFVAGLAPASWVFAMRFTDGMIMQSTKRALVHSAATAQEFRLPRDSALKPGKVKWSSFAHPDSPPMAEVVRVVSKRSRIWIGLPLVTIAFWFLGLAMTGGGRAGGVGVFVLSGPLTLVGPVVLMLQSRVILAGVVSRRGDQTLIHALSPSRPWLQIAPSTSTALWRFVSGRTSWHAFPRPNGRGLLLVKDLDDTVGEPSPPEVGERQFGRVLRLGVSPVIDSARYCTEGG